jgi:hypothetical protein
MNHNIWPTISGEHIGTPVIGILQFALTQEQSGRLTRARTRNIDREDQFDLGLWEPDDPMHGVEGIIFCF